MKSVIDVKGKSNIYLYGAGFFTKQVVPYLQRRDVSINGIIVSSMDNNPSEIEGIPVISISDISKEYHKCEEIDLLVCLNNGMKLVGKMLSNYAWKSLEYLDFGIISELSNDFVKVIEDGHIGLYLDMKYPNIEPGFAVLIDKKTNEPFARIGIFQGVSEIEKGIEHCRKESFVNLFGTAEYIKGNKKPGFERDDATIYVVTSHLDSLDVSNFNQNGYKPIQVGAVLTDVEKGCIKDSTGDNISNKNRNYCECTAHYWLWKNIKAEGYIGVNHYRRQQLFDDETFRELEDKNIDVVLSMPQFTPLPIKEFFLLYNVQSDWDMLSQAIYNVAPEYMEAFNDISNGHFFFPCNIMTAKKKFFDEYCEFAFPVAEEIERLFYNIGIVKENRYIGFLIEVMESVYLRNNLGKYSIAYTDISYKAPQ